MSSDRLVFDRSHTKRIQGIFNTTLISWASPHLLAHERPIRTVPGLTICLRSAAFKGERRAVLYMIEAGELSVGPRNACIRTYHSIICPAYAVKVSRPNCNPVRKSLAWHLQKYLGKYLVLSTTPRSQLTVSRLLILVDRDERTRSVMSSILQ